MPASSAAMRRRPALGHVLKRWLYIVHRWVGIATCLLFAMWFVSGLVMIYVPFPALDASARIAALAPVGAAKVRVSPAEAAARASIDAPETIALEMREGRPVWRMKPWEGDSRVIAADDGARLGDPGQAAALRIAARFGGARPIAAERIARDQWTVAGGYDRDRPLWKVSLAGPERRVVYVSSTSGAVVLATTAHERFWNWLGSVPHWIYPTVLRQDNAAWRQVVMWVSFPCIVAAIAGMWIGVLRVRLGKRRFGQGHRIPYRGWMAWHHVAGLIGGVALIAWIFSGWLSVDPFRLFASRPTSTVERMAYAGGSGPIGFDLAGLMRADPGVRRIELSWVAGRPLLSAIAPGRPALRLDARTLAPLRLTQSEIVAAAQRLLPGAPLRSVETLIQADAYWYEVGGEPTLPVLRLRFDDRAHSWLHIDPASGRVLGQLDNRRRLYRWAFDFLHKWDANGLTAHRPLWDIVLWLLSLLGIVTSVSGIWIGWRRLTRPAPRRG